MADVKAPAVVESAPELRPAPVIDLRHSVNQGLAGAVAMILVAGTGMVASFQTRIIIEPLLPLGLLFLYMVPFGVGWIAGRPPEQREGFAASVPGMRNVTAGLVAGLFAGLGTALVVVLINAVDMRQIFLQLSPQLVDTLTFGQPLAVGILLITAVSATAGALGGAVHVLPRRFRRALMPALMWTLILSLLTDMAAQIFDGLKIPWLTDLIYTRR
ncbi:MAG: hypothetical protein ACRDVD_01030, partial [Acidimicrobiia bacterium]